MGKERDAAAPPIPQDARAERRAKPAEIRRRAPPQNEAAGPQLAVRPGQKASKATTIPPGKREIEQGETARNGRWAAESQRRIRRLQYEGGGAWSAMLIRVDDVSDLAQLLLDPVRASLLIQWISAAARATGDDAPVCLDCDAAFGPHDPKYPAAYLLVTPFRPDPQVGMVTGICSECAARSDRNLMAAARRRLKSIWPDLRPLPPGSFVKPGGRA